VATSGSITWRRVDPLRGDRQGQPERATGHPRGRTTYSSGSPSRSWQALNQPCQNEGETHDAENKAADYDGDPVLGVCDGSSHQRIDHQHDQVDGGAVRMRGEPISPYPRGYKQGEHGEKDGQPVVDDVARPGSLPRLALLRVGERLSPALDVSFKANEKARPASGRPGQTFSGAEPTASTEKA
jgi:hypothetical protein